MNLLAIHHFCCRFCWRFCCLRFFYAVNSGLYAANSGLYAANSGLYTAKSGTGGRWRRRSNPCTVSLKYGIWHPQRTGSGSRSPCTVSLKYGIRHPQRTGSGSRSPSTRACFGWSRLSILIFRRDSSMVHCPLIAGEIEDPARLKRLIKHTPFATIPVLERGGGFVY